MGRSVGIFYFFFFEIVFTVNFTSRTWWNVSVRLTSRHGEGRHIHIKTVGFWLAPGSASFSRCWANKRSKVVVPSIEQNSHFCSPWKHLTLCMLTSSHDHHDSRSTTWRHFVNLTNVISRETWMMDGSFTLSQEEAGVFLKIYDKKNQFFFRGGNKNFWVGGNLVGSVGLPETHHFFFTPNL